jgi:hypothetical protein
MATSTRDRCRVYGLDLPAWRPAAQGPTREPMS